MLKLAGVTKQDVVYDLGCGDGRIVIAAAKTYGAHGVGIDIDPKLIRQARASARKAHVDKLVRFELGDLFKADIHDATVVTVFLLPQTNQLLRPKLLAELEPGTRIKFHFRSRALAKVGLVLGGAAVTVGSGFLWFIAAKGPGGDPSGLIAVSIVGPAMVYEGFDLPMTYFARDRGAAPHAFDPRKNALRTPPRGGRVRTS